MRGRLHRAIRDELHDGGHDAATYLDRLAEGGDALQALLNRITVQETAFFRHPEQFEVLARDVLPTLPQPVKIWSAGCANGQEPFSLAMLLEEQGIDGSVIGTDLSTTALNRTVAARYVTRELSGLSPRRIARHLTRTEDSWQINATIRGRVRTQYHNLLDPSPPDVRSCQVIFCRNVLIYLSPDHTRAFLRRIAETFPAATAIFLGAAETIWQVSDRFRAVPSGDTFIHRQVTADAVGGHGALRPAEPACGARDTDPYPTPAARASRGQRSSAEPPSRTRHCRGRYRFPQPICWLGSVRTRSRRVTSGLPSSLSASMPISRRTTRWPNCTSAWPWTQRATSGRRNAPTPRPGTPCSHADPAHSIAGIEGYATAELSSLLDSKQRRVTS